MLNLAFGEFSGEQIIVLTNIRLTIIIECVVGWDNAAVALMRQVVLLTISTGC